MANCEDPYCTLREDRIKLGCEEVPMKGGANWLFHPEGNFLIAPDPQWRLDDAFPSLMVCCHKCGRPVWHVASLEAHRSGGLLDRRASAYTPHHAYERHEDGTFSLWGSGPRGEISPGSGGSSLVLETMEDQCPKPAHYFLQRNTYRHC